MLLNGSAGRITLTIPRQPRLDAPGTLHHVMVRGLERRAIFRDDTDRTDFVARLAALAELVATVCAATGCHAPALQHGSRRAPAARAREGVAYLAVEVCGYPARAVADRLGGRPAAVYRATGARWERVLAAHTMEKNIRKHRPVCRPV